MAKPDKLTGARPPPDKSSGFLLNNFSRLTLKGITMTDKTAVYVSCKFCAIVCHSVTGRYAVLLYSFFLSFMTEKKEKYNIINLYRGLPGN
jgi:hypothetical protein